MSDHPPALTISGGLFVAVTRITPADHAQRRRAYDETGSDLEAAERLGLSYGTFRSWRIRQGLVVKKTRAGPRLSPGEQSRRRSVWELTDSDAEAAALLGIHPTTFGDWRQTAGLHSRSTGSAPGQGTRIVGLEERRRLDAWASSRSLREAAKKIGITGQSFESWAKRRGIPPQARAAAAGRIGLSPHETRLWEAYCTTLSDLEAANKAGIGRDSMRRWRLRQQLPGHNTSQLYWARLRQEAANGNPVARFFVQRRFPRTHDLPEWTEDDE